VNDAFRPTPTGEVLSQLKKTYPDFKADFIVACGNHPQPQKEEIGEIFGKYQLPPDSELYFHDSRDIESMVVAGELDGSPLYVNRRLFEYPGVLTIGSVEPHYFAGFTGGRKSLVPGLSDIESNRRNHALAVSEDAQPLRLKHNPVAENLDELLTLVKLPAVFSIQIVHGRNRRILDCFCGDLKSSFNEAVDLSARVYSFQPEKQYDLVIAEMRDPLDRNLYQLQKAIENCAAAVRDGGTILAVSRCREGIGNDEFYQLARRLKNEEMVLAHAEMENPPMGIHKLSRIVRMARRISVKALTGLKHEILEQVFLEPAISIDAEIQKLKHANKQEIDILLVRDAGLLAVKSD
jgi:nickel-dependent lactate racemase